MSAKNGGPALPRPASVDPTSGSLPDGDDVVREQDSMTLRDWFAGMAITGCVFDWDDAPEAARAAYALADAMIVARDGAS